MKRSQRLRPIIDLYARQEQDALLALGRSQRQLQDLQAQLEQLTLYRQEYLQKLVERQQTGMNVGQLQEFRAFADKLDKAITGQRQAVSLQQRDVQRASGHWEEACHRTKSLEKLAEIAVSEERQYAQKREQSEQDDFAARLARKDGIRNA